MRHFLHKNTWRFFWLLGGYMTWCFRVTRQSISGSLGRDQRCITPGRKGLFSPPSAFTVSNLGAWRRVFAPVCLSVKQDGGAEACFRPHLPYGEQLGGVETCFRPRLSFGGTFRDREIEFSARSATKLSSGGREWRRCKKMLGTCTARNN